MFFESNRDSLIAQWPEKERKDEQSLQLQCENWSRGFPHDVEQKSRATVGNKRSDSRAARAVFRNEDEVQPDVGDCTERGSLGRRPGEPFGNVITALHDAEKNKNRRPAMDDEDRRSGHDIDGP